ncbi:dam methylase [Serratia phage Parlo]|uniref:Dam methylase n=1 Tax=Serratia phage Parlo TaxID=2557554 RepID=A0A482MHR9_9CAUD|nr:dam methylase [Serratia phage Parlo]QBQ72174.1 dam methylase [Serratia phage Parlo]
MSILLNSGTREDDKNRWGTAPDCFADATALYGRPFAIDVCAEPLTAKCERYYASHELYDAVLDYRTSANALAVMKQSGRTCAGLDALALDWPEHWWCNPPFDQKRDFIGHARRQQAAGRPGMMLLPYEPLTGWWIKRLAFGCIIYEPDGRYQFVERDGVTKKQGVNFGSALVVFPTFHVAESPRIRFARGIGTVTNEKS